MKKSFILLALLALVFAACSDDDDIPSGAVATAVSDLQGTWDYYWEGAISETVTFSGDSIILHHYGTNGVLGWIERGTYALDGFKINIDAKTTENFVSGYLGEAVLTCYYYAYFTDKSKRTLVLTGDGELTLGKR